MKVTKPKTTKHIFIDATPDGNYALRILRVYRQDCDLLWSDNTAGLKTKDIFTKTMNSLQRKRAKELDLAISKLKKRV